MILACQNISKAFGTDEIIQHASFHVEENEKMAIVGINGAGKTTLLRIIMGELEADRGEVILAKNRTMGHLRQKLCGSAVSQGRTYFHAGNIDLYGRENEQFKR